MRPTLPLSATKAAIIRLALFVQATNFAVPILEKIGLFNIDGVGGGVKMPAGSFAGLEEKSAGKDTTIGHWEIAGLISRNPMPTYPNGFPDEIIADFRATDGKKNIVQQTVFRYRSYQRLWQAVDDEEARLSPAVTSADSVFQIAAHEDVVSVDELYKYCEIARKLAVGKNAVRKSDSSPVCRKISVLSHVAPPRFFSLRRPKTRCST